MDLGTRHFSACCGAHAACYHINVLRDIRSSVSPLRALALVAGAKLPSGNPNAFYGLRGAMSKVPETISRRLVSMRSIQAFRFARRRLLNPCRNIL